MPKKPITRIAVQRLAEEIMAGKYPADRPFATEASLGRRFSTSRMTVRIILARLAEKGLVIRRRKTGTFAIRPPTIKPVAILINDISQISSAYFTALLEGANHYLHAIGSGLLVASLAKGKWSASRSVCGIIIPPGKLQAEELRLIQHLKLPYIIIMESDLPGPTIQMKPQKAAFELTQGLLRLGHRNFAVVRGHDRNVERQKWQGIQAALRQAKISLKHDQDYQTDYDLAAAKAAAADLLDHRPRPSAVIAFDDNLALQVITAAQQRGLVIPRDLSVTGFNDATFSAITTPAISTVRFPFYEAGQCAGAALVAADLKNQPVKDQALEHEIIWRESTGPAPNNLEAGYVHG